MVKRSVKSKKRATGKSPASKAKASRKPTAKKRTTAKRHATPKAKAGRKPTAKKRTTTKRRVRPKAKAARKPTAKKRTTAKRRVRPKAKAARKSAAPKRATAKRRVTPKAKATRKSAAPKRATAKRRVTPKAKAVRKSAPRKRATAKRHVTPKAKAVRKSAAPKRAAAKKHVTPEVEAVRKSAAPKRATAKKHVTPKAEAVRKSAAPKRATAKKHVTPKAEATRKTTRKVARRRSPITEKGEFDFNAWLLPTLALEQFEVNVKQESGVRDNIKGSTRYAWIGAGQCGGRIVKSFRDLGYKKVLAVNTTHHDLDLLEIPEDQKFLMDIGEKGAGKDMERGKQAVQQHRQEILHLVRQTFGTQVDHIMVCFGAGGGTGSGSAAGLVEIAKRYARYIGLNEPDKKVGVLMTLPTVGEATSPLVAENAYRAANELGNIAAAEKISPLIIVDNDNINKMYPGMTVKSFWPSINNTVAGLFDIFNRLSALSSQYTSFDPMDYHSIMGSGGCAIMGLTRVNEFNDKFAISRGMKKNLEKTLLASGFDLSTAKVAGCIVVGGRKLMNSVKGLQDNINYAFDNLSEITGKATIHRGIYEDGREVLRVYTIIGGLGICDSRLEELKSCPTAEVVEAQ